MNTLVPKKETRKEGRTEKEEKEKTMRKAKKKNQRKRNQNTHMGGKIKYHETCADHFVAYRLWEEMLRLGHPHFPLHVHKPYDAVWSTYR